MLKDGQLLCDVCKQAYPASASERFAYKGQFYELDLCEPHIRKLGKVLDEFVAAARGVVRDEALNPAVSRTLPGES